MLDLESYLPWAIDGMIDAVKKGKTFRNKS